VDECEDEEDGAERYPEVLRPEKCVEVELGRVVG
jgi:hypothetical protein